ncbi:MAG: SDR family NAD(P)-dependent oxidoreductase [Clostridia bacterium]|nr:SDR family NAD(P)-dependent oxidoreductase [Clostridia bacterium]
MKNDKSKYVLVTGAYGGMGRTTVDLLRLKGYTVFALDIKVGEPCDGVIPIETDITSEEGIAAAFDVVRHYADSLFAIIHFAGVYMLDSLVEMQDADFQKIFQINLFGVYRINKTFLPLLQKGSRILITTSELAPLDPLPFTGVYAVTKGALDKYAYSLRMELQLLGIDVSVLRAGAVETGMLGVSTDSLDRFCQKTKLYSCNANRFKRIVEGVEARSVPPEKLSKRAVSIIVKRKPKFSYNINRNPLLLLLNVLPKSMQFWIIRMILK